MFKFAGIKLNAGQTKKYTLDLGLFAFLIGDPYKPYPAIPKASNLMVLNQKDHSFRRDLFHQPFQVTIILMVFDLHGFICQYYILGGGTTQDIPQLQTPLFVSWENNKTSVVPLDSIGCWRCLSPVQLNPIIASG